MQSGKIKGSELVEEILDIFKSVFGDDMILVERKEAFYHMGWFRMEYQYLTLQYGIEFENDRGVFEINIYDAEGAKRTLYSVQKYNSETEIANVRKAVNLLKKVLQDNNLYFYITRNGKMYRKKNNEYKRIRDITELMEK